MNMIEGERESYERARLLCAYALADGRGVAAEGWAQVALDHARAVGELEEAEAGREHARVGGAV